MASPWERLRRVDPRIWDTLLALAILAFSIAVLVVDPPREGGGPVRDADVFAFALACSACLPLIVRRRHALAVAVVVSIACAAYAALDYSGDLILALILASYSAAAHAERDRVVAIALPATVAAAVVIAVHDGGANWTEGLVQVTFGVGIPMMFGRIGFNRRRRIAREQERAAHDAVIAERARIARELHDVVAHAMSVMVVQAGAARTVVHRDPARAAESLRRIEETGRTGLEEMRRLIGVLKDESEGLSLAPQPGLRDLETLLTTVRDAGLAGRGVGRRHAAGTLARCRPHGLPLDPGSAHQRDQARRRGRACSRDDALPARGARPGDRRRRTRTDARHGRRPAATD